MGQMVRKDVYQVERKNKKRGEYMEGPEREKRGKKEREEMRNERRLDRETIGGKKSTPV